MASLVDNIIGVLDFSAFRPSPNDSRAAWSDRFARQRSLFLNINKGSVSWVSINKGGEFVERGEEKGEFSSVLTQYANEWKKMSDGAWVGVSINQRFMISLEKNLSRRVGFEQIIRSDPKSIIGTKYDRTKRYSITHHPTASTSLLLACDDSLIKSTEKSLVSNGFKVGRFSCGLFSMLSEILLRAEMSAGSADKKFCFIVVCADSIAILNKKGNSWSDLRCRSSIYSGDMTPITQMAQPIVERLEKDSIIYIAGDNPKSDLQRGLVKSFAVNGAKDYSRPDLLWKAVTT